jgi:hypothetical protein
LEFTTLDDEVPEANRSCSGVFDKTALRLTPYFPLGNGLWPISTQECFFPPLRATGFPYISHISSGLRWRGERYIPKNVFFLREEVLIYDAPSLPRKDDRFDQ